MSNTALDPLYYSSSLALEAISLRRARYSHKYLLLDSVVVCQCQPR